MKIEQQGSTLIEVLVVTTMITMVLTGIVAGLAFSVKNTAEGRYREFAATEAQKALEVFRRERVSLGWVKFSGQMINLEGANCMNELPDSFEGYASGGACGANDWFVPPPPGLGTDVKREVRVGNIGADEIDVAVTVIWKSGAEDREIEIDQKFRNTD